MTKKLQLMLLAALLALAVGVPVMVYAQTSTPVPGSAYVLVGNFSPNSPPVDILINGQLLGDNLSFSQATFPATVNAGEIFIQVFNANTNALIVDGYKSVTAGNYYMVPVMNVLERVQFGAYRIPVHEPLGVSETRVQFFHSVPGGPRLDVLSVGTTNSTIVNAMGYVEDPSIIDHVPAGVYRYQVWTDYKTIFPGSPPNPNAPPDTLAIDMGDLNLQGRVIYSFFVIGSPSPGGPPIVVLALAMPFGGGAPLAPPGPGGTVFKTPTPGPTPTITRTPTQGPTLAATATGSATRTPTRTTTPSVTLKDQTLTLDEGATYNISLTFDQNVTATVSYVTADGTAIGGTTSSSGDFIRKSGTLSYNNEKTEVFTITINEDTIDEPDEEFYINLTSGSSTARLTIVIDDDDPKPSVSFSSTTFTVAENSGSPNTVLVQLSNPSGQNVRVTLAITGGTATPGGGNDFTLNNTEVVINAGSTSRSVPITINNDTDLEPNETFQLTITDVNNAANIGTPATTTVTITDNDTPSLTLTTSSNSVSEGGTATLTVTRSSGVAAVSTVNVVVTSGSPADYLLADLGASGVDCTTSLGASCTVTFAAGETTKTIQFAAVIDGSGAESAEDIVVGLSSPTNATIGSPSSQTINIPANVT
jgi:hypothetical protein